MGNSTDLLDLVPSVSEVSMKAGHKISGTMTIAKAAGREHHLRQARGTWGVALPTPSSESTRSGGELEAGCKQQELEVFWK